MKKQNFRELTTMHLPNLKVTYYKLEINVFYELSIDKGGSSLRLDNNFKGFLCISDKFKSDSSFS